MAAVAFAGQEIYRKDFNYFVSRRREPASMLEARRAALERFETLGVPSTRQEAWRFTDVSALSQKTFQRGDNVPIDTNVIPALRGPHHRLTFVNGRYAPSLSRLQALPNKALVASLGQALLTHPEQVEAYLGCLTGLEDNPFVARNSAFWEDGAFLHLSRGVTLEYPLHLVFLTADSDIISHPRALLLLEEGARATVVVDHRGNGAYLTCPVTEIQVNTGATLDYYSVQEEDVQAWHLSGLRIRQERDSQFYAHMLSSGGLLARTDINALLNGEGAECHLHGLTLVKNTQLGDQHIRVEHAKPYGTSRQVFQGVLEDKGRTVFDGLINVHEQAQLTDASQNNRNLLLSRQALANSNPRLEILADDVKCNHGSTVGFLDPDALFYLRTRGIGEAEAKAMLVYAFANDSVEKIRLASLRERLERLLSERLRPDTIERISA
jgi:Fe-S cluster assembly protein SufD